MKPFAISYLHNGKRLSLWLYAEDADDVAAQLNSMEQEATVQEVVAMIPIASRKFDPLGWCLVLVALGVILWR